MADGEKSAKTKQNPKILVEKAIPKIVSALHSIIIKSKNKDFQERCLLKAQVNHTDNLPEKFESKLWEIAKYRMGVGRSSEDCEPNDQVVPQSNGIGDTSKELNAEEMLRKSQQSTGGTHEEDPFDELAFFYVDHTHPDINENFYEQEEVLIKPGTKELNVVSTPPSKASSQAGNFPLETIPQEFAAPHVSQSELLQTAPSKDDWLNDFAHDSYWMDKSQDDDDDDDEVQIVSISQRDGSKCSSTCTGEQTATKDHTDIYINTPQHGLTWNPKINAHKQTELHKNTQTQTKPLKETGGLSSSENLEITQVYDNSDCDEMHTGLSSGQSISANGKYELQCICETDTDDVAQSYEISGLCGPEEVLLDRWSSFYENNNNNLIDDFDALANLFDE